MEVIGGNSGNQRPFRRYPSSSMMDCSSSTEQREEGDGSLHKRFQRSQSEPFDSNYGNASNGGSDLDDLPDEISLLWALSLVLSPDDENDLYKRMSDAEKAQIDDNDDDEPRTGCRVEEAETERNDNDARAPPIDSESRESPLDEAKLVPPSQGNGIMRNFRRVKRSNSIGSSSSQSSGSSLSRAKNKILRTMAKSLRRRQRASRTDEPQSPASATSAIRRSDSRDSIDSAKLENEQRIGKCGAPMMASKKQPSLKKLTTKIACDTSSVHPEDHKSTPPLSAEETRPKLSQYPPLPKKGHRNSFKRDCGDATSRFANDTKNVQNSPTGYYARRSRLQTLDTNNKTTPKKNERLRYHRSVSPPLPPLYRQNKDHSGQSKPPMTKLRSALNRSSSDRSIRSAS